MAAEKSEFGVCGVVGGMRVIELLAGTMGLERISPEAAGRAAKRSLEGCRIAVVEDDMRQTYTVKHIRKGLTLLSYKKTVNV